MSITVCLGGNHTIIVCHAYAVRRHACAQVTLPVHLSLHVLMACAWLPCYWYILGLSTDLAMARSARVWAAMAVTSLILEMMQRRAYKQSYVAVRRSAQQPTAATQQPEKGPPTVQAGPEGGKVDCGGSGHSAIERSVTLEGGCQGSLSAPPNSTHQTAAAATGETGAATHAVGAWDGPGQVPADLAAALQAQAQLLMQQAVATGAAQDLGSLDCDEYVSPFQTIPVSRLSARPCSSYHAYP